MTRYLAPLALILVFLVGCKSLGGGYGEAEAGLRQAISEYQSVVGDPASSGEAVQAAKLKLEAAAREVVAVAPQSFLDTPAGRLMQDVGVLVAGLLGLNTYRNKTRAKALAHE